MKRSQVFIVGEREHGTRELVEAMRSFAVGEPIRATRRRIPTQRPRDERPAMIINDFGQRRAEFSDESFLEAVQGPKRPFLLIHCGDGYHRVMSERRCRAEAVVWVLSAQRPRDETLINDVLRARYLGAKAVSVFVMDAEDKSLAHACEQFARDTLSKYEMKGDETTVLFSTGPMTAGTKELGWREGVAQLYDALEREVPLPEDVVRPMTIVLGGRTRGVPAVGGVVRGEPVQRGMEVELPVLGKRSRIVRLAHPAGAETDSVEVGRWAECTLEGVSSDELNDELVLARPGVVRLVRSCVGRVCELNDEEIPTTVAVRGHATSELATIEWLDDRFVIPRRARLVFKRPTPWIDDNYVVLHDPQSSLELRETLLWLGTFDADQVE